MLDGMGPSLKNIERLDAAAMPMIQQMAQTGLMVDLDHFAKLEKTLSADMDRNTELVHTLTGYYINVSSPDQVADLLFKKLHIKQARPKMTPSGDRESVEDEVLKAIQHIHPVVSVIQDYKELDKLHGTYVVPMSKLAVHVGFGEWRMFPHFNTTRVPSGRLSCKDPNLLAMPNRTDRGREIRKGFITKTGWKYVSIDESQIEVRLAAHSSGDEALIRVYFEQEDVYSDFATTAFNLEDKRYRNEAGKWIYPTVHPMDHRYPAKTCILASIYDVSPPGLVEQMPVVCKSCGKPAVCADCSNGRPHDVCRKHDCHRFKPQWDKDSCGQLINAFYVKYEGVMRDRKRFHGITRQKGYCYDMWGRLLHAQAVRSIHDYTVAACLREVGNFPYQSGAQGTIKLCMAKTHDQWEEWKLILEVHPLLQVHDELIFETTESMAQDWGEQVRYNFETCCRLRVPIKAGVAIADTWGDLEK